MLLTLYLIALATGGTLVLASLALGGDHDADADAELEGDADASAEGHGDDAGWGDGFDAWLPVTSLRFWTFFLAFFGLTGTLLSGLSLAAATPAAVAAVAVGYISGVVCVRVIRSMQGQVVDSSVSGDDLIGAGGRVVVPLGRGQTGKVRLEIKGRTVEVLADTEEEAALTAGQAVMVYAVQDDGRVLVSRSEQLNG